MTKTRTFTPRDWQGLPLDPIKGAVHTLFGVPIVVHRSGAEWATSEPISGLRIRSGAGSSQAALIQANAWIERLGGACAMGSNMAGVVPKLSYSLVHDLAFLYGAGGPIDAPESICTGATRFSEYQYRHFSNPIPAHTYQVGVPR